MQEANNSPAGEVLGHVGRPRLFVKARSQWSGDERFEKWGRHNSKCHAEASGRAVEEPVERISHRSAMEKEKEDPERDVTVEPYFLMPAEPEPRVRKKWFQHACSSRTMSLRRLCVLQGAPDVRHWLSAGTLATFGQLPKANGRSPPLHR